MDRINFTQAIFYEKKKQIKRWMLCTGFVLIILLCLLFIISFMQWRIVKAAQMQKNTLLEKLCDYHTTMQNYECATQEIATTEKRLCKLEKYQQNKNNIVYTLETITATIPPSSLHELTIDKTAFKVHVTCAQPDQIIAYINTLNKKPGFSHVELTSMQSTTNNNLVCTIQGTITPH